MLILTLPQVHNALGFAYFNMDRTELALRNYAKAVELQPGYVTAWNNLGNAQEKAKDWAQVGPVPLPGLALHRPPCPSLCVAHVHVCSTGFPRLWLGCDTA